MSAPLRLHKIALACWIAVLLPSTQAAPLALSSAPPNANSREPAPNVILSIDDSGSMSEKLNPADPASGRKVELLRSSLTATFGDGSPNSGIIPDGRIRLAWHVMHNNGGSTGASSLTPGAVNSIRPFSGTHRQNFNSFVQSISADKGTPALAMMQRVFDYARTPEGLHSPWADVPGVAQSPSTKPYLSCRRMYNILLTDGGWNSQSATQRVSSGDNTSRTLGDGTTNYNVSSDQTRVFRSPHGDSTPASASTLADFAFHAWATDVQDGTGGTAAMANGVRPLINRSTNETFSTPNCTAAGNCVQTQPFWNPRNNPATWQHVSLFTIGFGLGTVNWGFIRAGEPNTLYYTNQALFDDDDPDLPSGWTAKMVTNPGSNPQSVRERTTPLDWSNNNPARDTFAGDFPRLVQGELQWPNPRTHVTWDKVAQDTRPAELWHAALNGRGRYFPVTTPAGLTDAFTQILNQVIRDTSVPLVSIATNANQLRQGMMAYIAGYSAADGSGRLSARAIDATTGAVNDTETWNAAAALDARTAAQITSRVVLTHSGAQGIPFKTLSSLPAAVQDALNRDAAGATDNLGQQRIDYLRGDQSRTVENGGSFRNRSSRLGAIVNSNVLYVGAPVAGQRLDNSFASFANTQRGRAPMLYVGANDGMLHGFQASDGAERLAYVPLGLAQGKLRQLSDTTHELSYLVDGSPFSGDAYLNGEGWRTLLVGTGGNGVKGWFVLDITDPANFTDAQAANVVRTDTTADADPDIGHIVSEPAVDAASGQSRQIVKLNNGRWAAVLGNGVNSPNEAPVLMLQYLDGSRTIHPLSPCPTPIATTACSFKGSNGLSTPAVVDINGDGVVDFAYAGDLRGHVWKFDLRGSDPAAWGVSFSNSPLFVASRSGVAQPITSAPLVAPHPAGGLMVVVGTGQNLTDADTSSTAQQSLYGLWDNSTYGATPTGSPINTVTSPSLTGLVQQVYNATPFSDAGSNYFVSSNQPVTFTGTSANRGWYLDWPLSGQRVVSSVRPYAGQKVLVESMIPAQGNDPTLETCTPSASGGRRFLSVLNLFNGGVPGTPPFTHTGTYATTTNATMIETPPGQSALFRAGAQIKQVASNCPSGQTCAAKTWNPGQTLGARAAWRQVLQ